MRRKNILRVALTALLIGLASLSSLMVALADAVTAPSLVISQLKITSSNGQFVSLHNSSNTTLDMTKFQLEYFNSYDLTKATSSKLVALTGSLPPHGYYLVSDGALTLCYQQIVDAVSLGFSSTAGMVEVLAFNQVSPGGSVSPILQDYVGWSKTAVTGAQTLPINTAAFLNRLPVDAQNNPIVSAPGAGSWQAVQPDPLNNCNLVTVSSNPIVAVQTGLNQLLPAIQPPVTVIIGANSDNSTTMPGLPAADVGLMAPLVTEILPNPVGTGTDATEEYIEIYNPNSVNFDLSGFVLQAGTTSLHNFNLPNGSGLPPHGFTAFYSDYTGLSLSNTGGQVKLLDPMGTSVSTTAVYGTAADGQAWALANGNWAWTTSLTPGAANVIVQPAAKKVAAKSSAAKSSKNTASKSKVSTAKTASSAPTALKSSASTASVSPIHPWTLALVAGLALLYGVYEYRADLANHLYQLRKYLGARRANRV